jgi:hypothetical protein
MVLALSKQVRFSMMISQEFLPTLTIQQMKKGASFLVIPVKIDSQQFSLLKE